MRAECLPGVAAIAREDWDLVHPDAVEDWNYMRACEASPTEGVGTGAIIVRDGARVLAAAPMFELAYRLDTPLQGRLRRFGDFLQRSAPALVEQRLLGLGSPFVDGAALGIASALSGAEREAVLACLLSALEAEAARRRAAILVLKDLPQKDTQELAPSLARAGFAAVRSLPLAVLALEGEDERSYLLKLSPATRKDVRRKLKRASALAVEPIEALGDRRGEIDALYRSTRESSEVRYGSFEELPQDYFARVLEAMPGRARIMLYRVDGRLVAFNLLLIGRDRVIDKFLGMAYPEGPANDVYVRSWMENVRLCLATGRRFLQSGQTAYREKLRLGSGLEACCNFVKHRNRVLNGVVRIAAPWLALDRWDPELGRRRAGSSR